MDQYLSRYEIHLENALAQLQTLKTLTPYLQINPYKGLLAKALEYEKLLDSGNIQKNLTMTLDEAVALIESFDQQLTRINEQKKELEDQKKELTALFDEFENYRTDRRYGERIFENDTPRFIPHIPPDKVQINLAQHPAFTIFAEDRKRLGNLRK